MRPNLTRAHGAPTAPAPTLKATQRDAHCCAPTCGVDTHADGARTIHVVVRGARRQARDGGRVERPWVEVAVPGPPDSLYVASGVALHAVMHPPRAAAMHAMATPPGADTCGLHASHSAAQRTFSSRLSGNSRMLPAYSVTNEVALHACKQT